MAGEQERIGDRARRAIADTESRVLVSAVVVWEVAIKRRLGKLEAPADLLEQLERAKVNLLPVTARHADRVGTLPMHHRDPFDRLLIAQADVDSLTIVTGDGEMDKYGVDLLW